MLNILQVRIIVLQHFEVNCFKIIKREIEEHNPRKREKLKDKINNSYRKIIKINILCESPICTILIEMNQLCIVQFNQ